MEWVLVLVDWGIIWFLGLLSVISIAVSIERYLVYREIDLSKFHDKRTLELELTKKLFIIATIGSNAPYIGLLGTVLGIMFTFYTIGKEGLLDPERIMVGLAIALKATAVGLLVAIPSIALYNFLLRKAKVLLTQWEIHHGHTSDINPRENINGRERI